MELDDDDDVMVQVSWKKQIWGLTRWTMQGQLQLKINT